MSLAPGVPSTADSIRAVLYQFDPSHPANVIFPVASLAIAAAGDAIVPRPFCKLINELPSPLLNLEVAKPVVPSSDSS